ncbi:hypothetical protein GRZ55_22115 [Chelativorans sp. ZYF759]|jgi:hypothetical protein|uniref:hypothetical protein n=1 Tax=Chelativorans sp. ZYF759 TaxID=2692213 RepID=UPI00145EBE13|nr:hypothetical protein [Chelativorans sp. ZYF759]NMG41928.1 hypothetical protein [Chelativorans sp. ZYF759]
MTTSDNTPTTNTRKIDRDKGRPDKSRSHSASNRKSVSAPGADHIAMPGLSPVSRVPPRSVIGADIVVQSEPDASPVGDRTLANDNRNDVAILRRDGHDPAIVIGLALRHVRLGRDVPFAIVAALFRHAEAGDGAAKATLEMLRRRVEQRQRQRWRRYVGKGLRASSLPGPHENAARLQGAQVRDGVVDDGPRGRDGARNLSLIPDCNDARDGEAGR